MAYQATSTEVSWRAWTHNHKAHGDRLFESIQFPELAQSFLSFGRDPARHAVIGYLSVLHDTKFLNVPDPDLAAAQFLGLINEPLLWPRMIKGCKSASKKQRAYVVDEAVKTFLSRYRAVNPTHTRDASPKGKA